MLNESYALCEAMHDRGIKPLYPWHDKMKAPPNYDATIEIRLNENGDVGNVLFLQSEQRWEDQLSFRAYELAVSGKDAGVRFPVISPNYQKIGNKTTPKENRIEQFNTVFSLKHKTLIEKLVPQLKGIITDESPLVLKRMLNALESEGGLLSLDGICSHLKEKESSDFQSLIQNNKSILICYELNDWRKHGDHPVNSTEILKNINQCLKKGGNREAAEEKCTATDAFGLSGNGCGDKFPTVKIKGFADIITLALNTSASKSYSRWGMKSASQAFRVGHDSREKIVEALEWATQPDLKGKTWRNLSNLTGNKEILIINAGASQEELWMDSFMPPERSEEADYVASARTLVRVIDGMPPEQMPENISVFGLRNTTNKMASVHAYGSYTPASLVKAAEKWNEAGANIPKLIMYNSSQEVQRVRAIYPAQTVWIVNHSNKAKKAPRLMDIREAFELFSDSGYQQQVVAERILSVLVGRPIRNLLQHAFLFRDVPAGLKPEVKKKDVRSLLLKLPCLLGIALYKINCKKEEYMSSAPYLIGQYLALLDEAHLLHYQVNNEGNPPKSLVGSRAVSASLDNPMAAVNSVGERAIIYIEWIKTKTRNADEEGKRLENLRHRIEENAYKLGQETLPETLTDAERAQLTLGYLAGPGTPAK